MKGHILTFAGAFFLSAWGIAHLVPTRSIIRGFRDISDDNRRIIAMEWITEGVALMFIGVLVSLVTLVDPVGPATRAVIWTSVATLNVLSVVSLFTGFRNTFIAFKLCPFIFSGSSILILIGSIYS
jgi:hypothetical protein